MYVNPFERMRKKREDEEKKRLEVEKEREKYARLGAQMGFTDDKAVVPSFIKTLIGESNQNKVPPFGMAIDNSFDNLPESNNNYQIPTASSNRTMEDFEKEIGLASNKDYTPMEFPIFSNNQTNFNQNNSANQQVNSFDHHSLPQSNMNFESNIPPFNRELISEQVKPNHNMSFESNIPPFNRETIMGKDISQPTINFEKQIDSFNNKIEEQGQNRQEDDLLSQTEFDEKYDDFFQTEEIEIINDKIINSNEYIELKSQNSDKFKNILIINNESLIDKNTLENLIELDLEKTIQYSSPCLFILKRIINNLPDKINIEDKRSLWEKTSLLLAATDWGKTNSEIDYILELLNLSADPIKLFIEEFNNLFDSYNFNEPINVILNNLQNISLDKILLINEFIQNLIMEIPNVSCITNIDYSLLDINRIEEIIDNYDYIVSDIALISSVTKKIINEKQYENNLIEEYQHINQLNEQLQYENYQNSNQIKNHYQNDNYQNFQQFNNYHEEPFNYEKATLQNLEIQNNENQGNLDQFFHKELKDVSIDMFETQDEGEIKLTYDKTDSKFTGNIPGISNNNFTEEYNSTQLPRFSEIHNEYEFEEQEEEYDPGIDSNLRIHVDQVLEKQKNEILEQEKREELARLQRKGESGFDPSILSKKEMKLNPYANPFENMDRYKSSLATRTNRNTDPRPRSEIEGKLNNLNVSLSKNGPINIEESSANEINKNRDTKLISVPGNWEKLKN
ncbi:hypothetical protein [Spiroplasma diminutum]|uniref:Uncharacterized protein n=1 Tax=Spiroplasma diminutum CUAS-1 TaxID=1276221 RepID=S5M0Y2_9MOLU|nr:hypothetical protein [Spiroplasma diminutum]AGR42511.1 hypothetical protein SDIMI_v3c08070 [Spiroplasma diminutum CUAS-1]